MLASTIITGNITAVPNWRTNNPVIIRPTDNQVFELGNISVSWHAIIGVNYFITLFDMTGDVFSVETVIARTELGTLNGFTINSRHLLPGRRYSLRLEAVSSNSTPGVSGVNFSVRGILNNINDIWDSVTINRINALHPSIRNSTISFILDAQSRGINLRITSGYRSFAEQDALFEQGRTAPGSIVTNARGGQSFHNYGLAIDVVEIRNGVAMWNKD